MGEKKINVAIDGFSSCGKSTLARDLAAEIDYTYIDSGAMYRAVTLYLIQNDINISDTKAVKRSLSDIYIDFVQAKNRPLILLNDTDVTNKIIGFDVSSRVSEVAAISAVRRKLVKVQQKIGVDKGVVMDGRDIGTVVFPKSELKLFMTANLDVRTRRRYLELEQKNMGMPYDQVKENLQHRDNIDSTRCDSPLRKADDAILLDNSYMSKAEQLFIIKKLFEERTS